MDDPDMVDGFYFGEPEAVMHNNWIRLHHVHTNATVACRKNKSIVATKLNLVYAIPYVSKVKEERSEFLKFRISKLRISKV